MQDKNYSVKMSELARDGRVVDAGLNFVGQVAGGKPPWSKWWEKADLVEVGEPERQPTTQSLTRQRPAAAAAINTDKTTQDNRRRRRDHRNPAADHDPARYIGDRSGGAWCAGRDGCGRSWRHHRGDGRARTRYQLRHANRLRREISRRGDRDAEAQGSRSDRTDAQGREGSALPELLDQHECRAQARARDGVECDGQSEAEEAGSDQGIHAQGAERARQERSGTLVPRSASRRQIPAAGRVLYARSRRFDKGHIVRREDVNWGTTYKALRCAPTETPTTSTIAPSI